MCIPHTDGALTSYLSLKTIFFVPKRNPGQGWLFRRSCSGISFFEGLPALQRKLTTLFDVGLDYIKIGQSSTTLSGGEAQRVKLATELAKRSTGKTIYILDEPTTGLHTEDVAKLIGILQRLADGGNTVVVIEHNLDLIKTADHIIDLGPEGGEGGGTVVVTGTPEQVATCESSYTGQFLREKLSLPLEGKVAP